MPQWPHNTGPLMTYMALCEGTTCDKYDATNANWFKIDEAGLKPDGSGWWQQDISEYSHRYMPGERLLLMTFMWIISERPVIHALPPGRHRPW